MHSQDRVDSRKDATEQVQAAQRRAREGLPFSDDADFGDAARGFLGTREGARITSSNGRVVWSLEPYDFLSEEAAPATVHPSLWRQARLNMHHGLFEVTRGVYQVRGFDIANMTLVEGETGVIVIDALTSIEGARAAMELYFEHRGRRPVVALMFTHTHSDHWGGGRGVCSPELLDSGKVAIIAPDLFMEHAVSENVIAGPAMLRRAQFQFGPLLDKGPRGHVDCGLGKSMAMGAASLVAPTDLVKSTGERRSIDGIEFQFQMAPNSEAPAEMHIFLAGYRVLNLAENATRTFHNLLPFRGADVRDALAWSRYIDEALSMWGAEADVLIGQHHWPVWGAESIQRHLRQQRDLYKFVHDQTVRLMNHGYTASEIAEELRLPPSLENVWHARGYYGHLRHNVKAIYQKYLGWYDANPANLDPLPPAHAGRKFIEYMGGADSVLAHARRDFENGEFRFVAQALSHLVFADPANAEGRALLADTFEQLGYLAESAAWRNAYLLGAQELRRGMAPIPPRPAIPKDTLAALRTEQIWDMLGVRVRPELAIGKTIVMNWRVSDRDETFILTLDNCALTCLAGARAPDADASYSLLRRTLDDVVFRGTGLADAIASGAVEASGRTESFEDVLALLDEFPRMFEVVEPRRKVRTSQANVESQRPGN
ncbi:MAG: MBL fold metallo-hydrolase [Hyphomicrobiales bacterium]|nr:MBL fold metallo-hydrolase [Hyphomicrobiales bacterium]